MEYDVTREYLERRYRDSLAMAERAADPAIARVHREFAAKYARALEGARASSAGESRRAVPLPPESSSQA
ncbi:hypothetical protein ACMGDH_16725 [Sphingomonas sp. DT-207]|uniref:hypothetical protein n=1 Tax=Sphingomonas sp. DT-207 TaxID=3396167 RepID=UPI003F1E4086